MTDRRCLSTFTTAFAVAALVFSAAPSVAAFTAYTDRNTFLAAVGGAVRADDFESYALGAIADGATLGNFKYSFVATVQPTVVPGGSDLQDLGGPFELFVGGDSFLLSYTPTPAPVPEPSTVARLLFGFVALATYKARHHGEQGKL